VHLVALLVALLVVLLVALLVVRRLVAMPPRSTTRGLAPSPKPVLVPAAPPAVVPPSRPSPHPLVARSTRWGSLVWPRVVTARVGAWDGLVVARQGTRLRRVRCLATRVHCHSRRVASAPPCRLPGAGLLVVPGAQGGPVDPGHSPRPKYNTAESGRVPLMLAQTQTSALVLGLGQARRPFEPRELGQVPAQAVALVLVLALGPGPGLAAVAPRFGHARSSAWGLRQRFAQRCTWAVAPRPLPAGGARVWAKEAKL